MLSSIFLYTICCRCSYLKDDDVGYFAVNTVQVKIFYLTMHDIQCCVISDKVQHGQATTGGISRFVAAIFFIDQNI